MERIDLYIQEVTRRLPEKSRADIEKELQSTIYDMMPDDYNDDDVNKALLQLGNPAKLAQQYQERPTFLIGPKFYDSYFTILKMSAFIGIIIAVAVAAIDHAITHTDDFTLLESALSFMGILIGVAFQALMGIFAWTTVTFAILERVVDDASLKEKGWTPDELKFVKAIEPKRQISKVEVFFSLFWTAIWATVYFKASDILGIYEKSGPEDQLLFVEPLFNQEVLLSYWPLVCALIAFDIALVLYKWLAGRWTEKMAVLNAVYHTSYLVVAFIILSQTEIFNDGFLEYMSGLFMMGTADFMGIWDKVIYGILMVIIITTVLDIVAGLRKGKK